MPGGTVDPNGKDPFQYYDETSDSWDKWGRSGGGPGPSRAPGALTIASGAYGGGSGPGGFGFNQDLQSPFFRRRLMGGADLFSGKINNRNGNPFAPRDPYNPPQNPQNPQNPQQPYLPQGGGVSAPPGANTTPHADPHNLDTILWQLINAQGGPNTWNNLYNMLAGGGTLPGTVFSPYGTDAGNAARRQEGQRIGDALARRNALAASQANLDPSQRGFGQYWSGVNTQGGLADAYNQSVNQNASDYERMLRNLFMTQMGASNAAFLSDFNRQTQQLMQPQGPQWWDYLANIAGQGVSAWLGKPQAPKVG